MISGWSACRTRIEDGFRALRKRGQSETLGVALLTGVVLILVAVVGLFLFADFGANDEEQLLANIDGDVEATNITLSHEGGDEFAPGEIEVVLTGDVSRELRLNESFDATTGGDGSFAPGDVWKSNSTGLIVGEGRLLVIHTVSDTILLDQPYAIEEDGVDLAVENHPNGNFRSDQATIHGNANWSYDILATLGGTSYEETDNINYTLSFEGSDTSGINWYDDGNHEIEVGSISSQKTVTATATIYRENGIALNETGEVELTVKPEPSFTVSITDTEVNPSGSTLATNSGQLGVQADPGFGENEIKPGDTIAVTARIENNNGAAVGEQSISMSMDKGSNTMGEGERIVELVGGDTKEVTFEVDIPTSPDAGMYEMTISTEEGSSDSLEMLVNSLPNFEVGVTNIDDPVAVGDPLDVTAEITNTGTMPDTQVVTVDIAGNSEQTTVSIGGGTADKTTTTTVTIPAVNVGNPGFWPVEVSSNNDSTTKDATILELDIGFGSGTTTEASAGSNEDVTLEADVSLPSGTDLDGESVSTTVTLDASSLKSGATFSEDITLSDSNTEKTISRTFTPNYASLDPQSYTVTASEDLTGTDTDTGVTVLAPDIGISVVNAPDSVEVGSGFDVTYEVTNSGNQGQDGDVNFTVTLNNGSVEQIGSKNFDLSQSSSDTGTFGYSGSDILDDGFGGGDTVEFTLKAEDGTIPPDVLDTATGSVDLTQPSSSILNIDDTNSPVVAGERITATTGVDLTGLTSSLGTQGLGTEQLGPTLDLKLTVLDGNGNTLGTNDTSLLENLGSSLTKTLSVPTNTDEAGSYTAQIELLGLVELSESEPVTVESPNPNLQFDYAIAPSELTIGTDSELTVEYQVANTGNAEASTIIDLSVDKTTGSEDNDTLDVAPGERTSGTLVYSFTNDYSADESINWDVTLADFSDSRSGTTNIVGDPANFDVSILDTNDPDAGDELAVNVQVTNTGDKTGTVDVSMSIPDIGSKTTTMQDMTGDEVRTHTFNFGTSSDDAGEYTATADTGDDTATEQVGIKGANIQIVSASGPSQIAPGDDLSIDYTLENVGTKEGTESFVDLYIDGTAFGDIEATDFDVIVPAGGTESGTLTFSGDTGSYDTIDWTVELWDFGSSKSGNVAVDDSGGGGGTASFAVTITDTNSPVKEGNVLDVDVQVNNIGGAQGTQTIDLSTGGLGSASTGMTLGAGDSTTETLSVSTSNGDAGDYTASVSSEDTSASTTVTVTTGAAPSQFNIQIDSIAGQNDPVVEVPAGASGTTVDVDYTVENTGGKGGSTSVDIERNGNNVGSTSEAVPPGQTRSGTFSVNIDDNHLSGSGINIEVTTTDDSATETVETKALRIVTHNVDDQVHPFLYENMTTVVENVGSADASDTLKITDYGGDYQSTMEITVRSWQSPQEYHVGLDQSTAENMFGKSDYANAELVTYGDSETGGYVDFDIHGDVWLKQDYVDDLSMDDSTTNPSIFDCAFSLPPNLAGCLDVDFTLEPGSPSDVVVPDGMSKSNINGGFRLYGEGSFLGDFPGSITDSTIVLEESLGQDISYTNRVTESSIFTDPDQSYYQISHILTQGNDVLEYEFPDIVNFPSNIYCGITGDFGEGNNAYETTKDKPFSSWASNNDWTEFHLTQYDESNNYQCDELNSGGGFFGP